MAIRAELPMRVYRLGAIGYRRNREHGLLRFGYPGGDSMTLPRTLSQRLREWFAADPYPTETCCLIGFYAGALAWLLAIVVL